MSGTNYCDCGLIKDHITTFLKKGTYAHDGVDEGCHYVSLADGELWEWDGARQH